MRGRHRTASVLAIALLVAACSTPTDEAATVGADAAAQAGTTAETDGAPDSEAEGGATAEEEAAQEPAPEAEPEPAYTPPVDWQEQALVAAEAARRAVVAVGWRPPTMVLRRLETGWLVSPDLVVTSPDVACEARQGTDLRIRTFDGTFRDATIEAIVGPCSPWENGVALLRLARPVDAPILTVRDPGDLTVGEPLLTIGHSNQSAAVGGWLVLAGPVVEQDGGWIWTDTGATVNYRRIGEFFGGGFSGAPVIDLDGEVVTVLCCERDWGPQIDFRRTPLADPVLRQRLTVDQPYFTGGIDTDGLVAALRPHLAAG